MRTRVESGDDPALRPCLWWGDSAVVFNQSDFGNPVTGDAAFDAVSKALASWQAAMAACGSLTLSEGPRLSNRSIGYDANSTTNPNTILFRTRFCSVVVPSSDPCLSNGDCANRYDCWAYGRDVIALTTTHFKVQSGQILHVDIELNSASYYFTAVDSPPCTPPWTQSCVAWDIQNAMTHEFGHSLGLDHTSYPISIMTPTTSVGETWKRTIDTGSSQFVCDVYPTGLPPRDCHKSIQADTCPADAASDPSRCHRLFGCSAVEGGASGATLLVALAWLFARRQTGIGECFGRAEANRRHFARNDATPRFISPILRRRALGAQRRFGRSWRRQE